MSSTALDAFKAYAARTIRLGQAGSVLGWDQQTYMPPGAAASRAEQLATLSDFLHDLSTGAEARRLLEAAEAEVAAEDPEGDAARMVKVARRDFDQATKLPKELVIEMARQHSLGQEVWVEARRTSDFATFAPTLEKMLDLTRQQAEHLGYKEHIYDALIDLYEPGMTQREVASIFADMKPGLVSLTREIAGSSRPVDDALLHGEFPVEKQKEITLRIVGAIGYDLTRGRQDIAAHPFCTNFSRDDVRITTRFDPRFLNQAVYASMHEAGHAMYEQNQRADLEATPLSGGTSLGVHESQSRLWENLVGRSRAFSDYLLPQLSEAFPGALVGRNVDEFYRAINRVTPSFIRVEADEVTYNLHILLRFELECELLTGALAVRDLPAAWNARMEEYFGITPPDNAHGVLQDVHWSAGLIGYFPTYTLGNLLSVQLWTSAEKSLGDIYAQIQAGEFAPLLGWLRENVHQLGRKYMPRELVLRVTGEPLTAVYYERYLRAKYADIYGL